MIFSGSGTRLDPFRIGGTAMFDYMLYMNKCLADYDKVSEDQKLAWRNQFEQDTKKIFPFYFIGCVVQP